MPLRMLNLADRVSRVSQAPWQALASGGRGRGARGADFAQGSLRGAGRWAVVRAQSALPTLVGRGIFFYPAFFTFSTKGTFSPDPLSYRPTRHFKV